MQAARPDAPGGDAAGDLVEQFDGAVTQQVVGIAAHQVQRRQRQHDRFAPVARALPGAAQPGAQRRQAFFAERAQGDGAVGFVEQVVALAVELPRQRQRLPQEGAARGLRRAARQDQRHLGLVEQDAVGLVEQRHAQAAHQRGRAAAVDQVAGDAAQRIGGAGLAIAQEVEGQILGRGIDDVVAVLGAPRGFVVGRIQRGHAEPERGVQRRQPGRVARRQVGVGGDHVHRHRGQRGDGRGQRDGQGLALAGGHLGHAVVEQHRRGQALRVAGLLRQRVLGAGAGDAERLRQRRTAQAVAAQRRAQHRQRPRPRRGVETLPGLLLQPGPRAPPRGSPRVALRQASLRRGGAPAVAGRIGYRPHTGPGRGSTCGSPAVIQICALK